MLLKRYKLTVAYCGLLILPGAALLLLHFYRYIFTNYQFSLKDGQLFIIIAVFGVFGPLVSMLDNELYHG